MEYVQQRTQFGRPVGDFQHNQFKLADMMTQVHASRLLVRQAARSLDAKAPTATADAAMAKRFATDACYDVTNDALQLLGGYGYLREYPIERCVGVLHNVWLNKQHTGTCGTCACTLFWKAPMR